MDVNLSIIIPTYNRNHTLAECIQALRHNEAEIVVVDDGSDAPVEAMPNVTVLRHQTNRGRAAAINTGLRAAAHDMVLILDDDIYAAPDMVTRLAEEYLVWNNPKLALVGRVVWHPDVMLTPTMRWMEDGGPLQELSSARSRPLNTLSASNTILWRPFVLEHGGFDQNFKHHSLEDTDLGIRLKQHGLFIHLLSSAVGYHHKLMTVQDLANRQLREGAAAVYLHSKFPDFVAHVDDAETLTRNLEREKEAATAIEQIGMHELAMANTSLPGSAELFKLVYRYCSLKGIFDALKAADALPRPRNLAMTHGLYDEAHYLEEIGELHEARRLFRLVRERRDQDYWAHAEFRLSLIESALGNPVASKRHLMDCLRLDPQHEGARSILSTV